MTSIFPRLPRKPHFPSHLVIFWDDGCRKAQTTDHHTCYFCLLSKEWQASVLIWGISCASRVLYPCVFLPRSSEEEHIQQVQTWNISNKFKPKSEFLMRLFLFITTQFRDELGNASALLMNSAFLKLTGQQTLS